jgi:hypothetical protein
LSHNDLGPIIIIVNANRIAVLDWEMAGYAPLEWVRTKFGICGALCVERVSSAGVERNSEWPVRVEQKLGGMGLPEVAEAYIKRASQRIPSTFSIVTVKTLGSHVLDGWMAMIFAGRHRSCHEHSRSGCRTGASAASVPLPHGACSV